MGTRVPDPIVMTESYVVCLCRYDRGIRRSFMLLDSRAARGPPGQIPAGHQRIAPVPPRFPTEVIGEGIAVPLRQVCLMIQDLSGASVTNAAAEDAAVIRWAPVLCIRR